MSTKQSTADYVIDQLGSLEDVSIRKMFGEYALYFNQKVVGLVCDDTVFIKITEAGKKFVWKSYQEGKAYVGAKPSMRIADELLENHEWISHLVRITADALPVRQESQRSLMQKNKTLRKCRKMDGKQF